MAAPTLAQIREGLRANLATIGDDVQTSAYRLANPTMPSVQVLGPDEIEFHKTMQNGHDQWALTVMAFAGLVSGIGAQKVLDQFIPATGTRSVKAAIESDKTLGGLGVRAIVESCTGYREYAVGNPPQAVLGAEWRVRLEADGA